MQQDGQQQQQEQLQQQQQEQQQQSELSDTTQAQEKQQQQQTEHLTDSKTQSSGQQAQAGQLQAAPEPISQLGNCTLLSEDSNKRIWECPDFCGRPCLIKQSKQQAVKHPLLARKVAKQPCQQDAAGLCRVRKLGVPTPTPFHVNTQHNLVYMSAHPGSKSLQQHLQGAQELNKGLEQLLSRLGQLLALMHDGGVVHGALSSSCVLVCEHDQALLLCDFECFSNSVRAQDKAADLAVLEADLQDKHPHLTGLFDKVLASYNKHNKQWSAVFNRLPEVRNHLRKHKQGPSKKKARTQ